MTCYLNSIIDYKTEEFVLHYDQLPMWSAPFGLLLMQNVPMRRDAVVLDVGCGTGFPLIELASRMGPSATIHGIDPWEQAIQRAQSKINFEKLVNARVSVGNAEEMPFPDATFDLIVSNLGVNNFENPKTVIKECRRVLKPGGMIGITTNLFGHMRQFYEVFRQTLIDLDKHYLIPKLDNEEAHRTTIASARGLFESVGLKMSQAVEASFTMRYSDGTAFLNDFFTRLAFLESWRAIIERQEEAKVFGTLEENLNQLSSRMGHLELTVPMAYLEFKLT